jgi:hypothetical protein
MHVLRNSSAQLLCDVLHEDALVVGCLLSLLAALWRQAVAAHCCTFNMRSSQYVLHMSSNSIAVQPKISIAPCDCYFVTYVGQYRRTHLSESLLAVLL